MLIFALILGLILTRIENGQSNKVTENTPNPANRNASSNTNYTQPSRNWDFTFNQTQKGIDYIRNETRSSESLTAGRSDGYRASYTTYMTKGFYAQAGYDRPNSSAGSPMKFGAIGGLPVPTQRAPVGYGQSSTNNRNGIDRPWITKPFGQNSSQHYHAQADAKASIGGSPVPTARYPDTFMAKDPFLNEKLDGSGASTRTGIPWSDAGKGDDDVTLETERQSWQVSVFSKEVTPHIRVCGGSLVTKTAVISAAHCYWGVGALPARQFAVAAGPTTRMDSTDYSSYLQKIDVHAIKIPPRFRGASSNYQDDIAVLMMAQPFSLQEHLQPICVSFNQDLDEQQLAAGSRGTVLGKALDVNSILMNHKVPVISIEECLRLTPEDRLKYITSDKICAGVESRPIYARVCVQDAGSGLAFVLRTIRAVIPFLRGVASTPLFSTGCSAYGVNSYTHLVPHRSFLLENIPGLEEDCVKRYPHLDMLLNGGIGKKSRWKDKDQGEGDQGEEDQEEEDMEEGTGEVERFVCNCYC